MIGKHYLYRHIRNDKNEVFYVGIGTKYEDNYRKYSNEYLRAFSHKNRNKYWKNIINQTDYEVEILLESDDYEFIKQKEIEFIVLYGRRNLGKGTLVNFTDGGQGVTGRILSEQEKENLRESTSLFFKGKKQSEEHIRKRFLNMTGENNPKSKRVLDIITKEIFPSLKSAALKYGYNYSTLKGRLRGTIKNNTNLRWLE